MTNNTHSSGRWRIDFDVGGVRKPPEYVSTARREIWRVMKDTPEPAGSRSVEFSSSFRDTQRVTGHAAEVARIYRTRSNENAATKHIATVHEAFVDETRDDYSPAY